MKTPHIVLRMPRQGSRDVFGGPMAFNLEATAAAFGQPSMQLEALDRRDIPLVTRDADVLAVAPVMPVTLIEPRAVHDTTAAEADDIGWGVRAVRADTAASDGSGIVVAVLDTGIDAGHPAFAGVELVHRNFTQEDGADLHGHGTHCAGTIFGRAVGNVRIGVAPGVRKALIGKVLGNGGGSSEQIVQAVLWAAEHGAHVVSMSLGIDFPGYQRQLQDAGYPPELATSRALEGYRANVKLFELLAGLVHAGSQPTVIVAAAGNESRRQQDPRFEIAVSPPAAAPGIVSVAAVGRVGNGLRVADFSNTGANVSGPGVDIVSAARGGGLRTMSGTSMATPHVAGVAALWADRLRANGALNVLTLTSKLVGTARLQGLFDGDGGDAFDVGAGLVVAPQE